MATSQYLPRLSSMRTVALAIASLASPPCVHAADFSAPDITLTPIETRSVDMALPDTPQELWRRIVILLQKNGGFTPRKDVEEVIGIRFTHMEKEGEKRVLGAEYFYSFTENSIGLGTVSVSLFDDSKQKSLSVSWGPEKIETPDCMDLDQATRDLESLGWRPGARSRHPGRGSQQFYKVEDWAAHRNSGKPLDVFSGTSELSLLMPNQFSRCVNAISVDVWRR
jgi:hypothetical protein